GVDPTLLVGRLLAERDVSTRRALLLALGEYPLDRIAAGVPEGTRRSPAGRGAVSAVIDTSGARSSPAAALLAMYRDDPDPGIHGALDWLLRRCWGHADEAGPHRQGAGRPGAAGGPRLVHQRPGPDVRDRPRSGRVRDGISRRRGREG